MKGRYLITALVFMMCGCTTIHSVNRDSEASLAEVNAAARQKKSKSS